MRIGPRVVRGGAFSLLIVTAGLASTHAVAGTIVVTAVTGSPPLPAAAQIRILERPISAITNAEGRARLSLPAGTYTVRAVLPGTCTADVTAVVGDGGTVTIKFTLGPGPCTGVIEGGSGSGSGGSGSQGTGSTGGTGNDRITTGNSQPLHALVDIRIGSAVDPKPCDNDLVVQGTTGTADLPVNALALTDPSVPCHGAAWVFTEDHAPWFDNTAGTFPWTNGVGDVLTTTLPANRLRVPVTFWIADPLVDDAAYRMKLTAVVGGDLALADTFLRKMHTGLRLTNSETADTPPDINSVAAQSSVIGRGCGNTSSITAAPPVYNANHINIYVVDAIAGDGSPSGRNCVVNGAKNVIFIRQQASYVILLHEIGHALGLTRPSWGHADEIKDMLPNNVMKNGASVAGLLTLGQIARAHADTSSWLNQETGSGTVRSRQSASTPFVTACHCPGDTATTDCPMITKDIFRLGGMPGPGIDDPACHVTSDITCLSLPPSMPGTITARGFTDNLANKDGFGDPTVGSLSPAIAAATKSPLSDGKTVIADVVAGPSPGTTTHVLLSLGGTFVKVKVNVGLACPP